MLVEWLFDLQECTLKPESGLPQLEDCWLGGCWTADFNRPPHLETGARVPPVS